MAVTEVDTFIRKFHQLWKSGVTAHLDLDTHAGNAWVGLRVQLGHVPGPLHHQVHPQHQQAFRKVSPSRLRRRARRLAARENASFANTRATGEVATTSSEEEHANTVEYTGDASITEKEENNDPTEQNEKTTEKVEHEKVDEKVAENASGTFQCLICDFTSTWENGLSVHMGKKHGNLEQLDGQADIDEIEIDEKYENTEHYWKRGWLGMAYHTFLDANSVIEKCKISEDEKKKEKEKILEARKLALGSSFKDFPPWSKKS